MFTAVETSCKLVKSIPGTREEAWQIDLCTLPAIKVSFETLQETLLAADIAERFDSSASLARQVPSQIVQSPVTAIRIHLQICQGTSGVVGRREWICSVHFGRRRGP
jgi:hypothetical protein